MGTSPGCRQAPSASTSWALGSYCGGVRRARLFSPPVGVGSPEEALAASAGHHPDELWEGVETVAVRSQHRTWPKAPFLSPCFHTASVSFLSASLAPEVISIAPHWSVGLTALPGLIHPDSSRPVSWYTTHSFVGFYLLACLFF